MVLRDGSSVVIRLLATVMTACDRQLVHQVVRWARAETLYARLFVLRKRLDRFPGSALACGDRSVLRYSWRSPLTG